VSAWFWILIVWSLFADGELTLAQAVVTTLVIYLMTTEEQ
jgi:hypothetical protein